MPFKPSLTFPAQAPDVQIFFHGLLMLCPDAGGTLCKVGVHRLSIEHKLSVSVRERNAEPPDPPLLRLSGPLDSTGLSIAIEPASGKGVSQFVPTPEPFDRTAQGNDEKDFRWSVDLEKLDPAQPPIILEQSGISPEIIIKDGIFFTAQLTDPAKLQVLLTSAGSADIDLHRVARLLGANIYLDFGQIVVLRWFADGKVQTLSLPGTQGNRTFVVYIDNSPSLMPIGKPTHSEFIEYFKVVTNVARKFDLDFNLLQPSLHGSDLAPCMPTTVGGGGGGGT